MPLTLNKPVNALEPQFAIPNTETAPLTSEVRCEDEEGNSCKAHRTVWNSVWHTGKPR